MHTLTRIQTEAQQRKQMAENILGRRITAAEERAISHVKVSKGALHSGVSFARLLQSILSDQITAPIRHTQQTELGQKSPQNPSILSLNPHINLRVMTQAHPEAKLVFEDGNFKLEVKAPELTPPELQKPEQQLEHMQMAVVAPLEIATGIEQQRLQRATPRAEAHQAVGMRLQQQESAYGVVLAPQGLASKLMGQGVAPLPIITQNSSLQALLAPRWKPLPVDKSPNPFGLSEATTYWDKIPA